MITKKRLLFYTRSVLYVPCRTSCSGCMCVHTSDLHALVASNRCAHSVGSNLLQCCRCEGASTIWYTVKCNTTTPSAWWMCATVSTWSSMCSNRMMQANSATSCLTASKVHLKDSLSPVAWPPAPLKRLEGVPVASAHSFLAGEGPLLTFCVESSPRRRTDFKDGRFTLPC